MLDEHSPRMRIYGRQRHLELAANAGMAASVARIRLKVLRRPDDPRCKVTKPPTRIR